MPDIFRKTLRDREEKAGTQPKSEEKVAPKKPQMSQADFFKGGGEKRPPMSRKWVESQVKKK